MPELTATAPPGRIPRYQLETGLNRLTPAERAAILKQAFMATQRDPAYLAEAHELKIDISPLAGDDIQALLARLAASPPALIALST